MWVWAHECRGPWRSKVSGLPGAGAGAAGSCELPDTDARNWTLVRRGRSTNSWPLIHLSETPFGRSLRCTPVTPTVSINLFIWDVSFVEMESCNLWPSIYFFYHSSLFILWHETILPFYGWVIVYCMLYSHFVHPFISWCIFGLFPVFYK